jgi:hypothetical protein
MSIEIRSAIDFYERHPISSEIILAKLNASRGHLNDMRLTNCFHTTKITMVGWTPMMRWRNELVLAKAPSSSIFALASAVRHATWLTVTAPMSPA